jgi:hypothetical protein
MQTAYNFFIFTFFLFASFSSMASGWNGEIRTIHVEKQDEQSAWIKLGETEQKSVQILLNILKNSPTGSEILNKAHKRAQQLGEDFEDVVLAGDGSLTDTTLIRRFSPASPNEMEYETRSKVYVNRRLRVVDAVLDLAHELTHYSFRTPFNPYDKNFTLQGFVKSTVEGTGGEVEAFLIECQVLDELFAQEAAQRENCQKIIDPKTGRFSKQLGVEYFYRVGAHMPGFKREMQDYQLKLNDFPHLSKGQALFISSAWGLPYPVAAFKEYVTIMGRACENDLKRLSLLKNRLTRSPASFSESKTYQKMHSDFSGRCQQFEAQL